MRRTAQWVKLRRYFDVRSPLFHATNGPRAGQIVRGGGIKAKSGFSNFGNDQVGISTTRNLSFALRGDFGPYIFVLDGDALRRRFPMQPTQHPFASDEFEERIWTDHIPLSMFRGVIIPRHLIRFEVQELAEEWPFPVVYKDRKEGWTLAKQGERAASFSHPFLRGEQDIFGSLLEAAETGQLRTAGSLSPGLSALRKRLIEEHHLDALWLHDYPFGFAISEIAVLPEYRGQGHAQAAMEALVRYADQQGVMIALTPDNAFGSSKGRLTKWYRSLGFVPNKGRNKSYRFRETMIRHPKTASKMAARPIKLDKRELRRAAKYLAEGLVSTLSREDPNEPIGRWELGETWVEVPTTAGENVTAGVYLVSEPTRGVGLVPGAGSGTDRRTGEPAIVLKVNGKETPKYLLGAVQAGRMEGELYKALLHEATHVADVYPAKRKYKADPKRILSDAEMDEAAYYNDPKEVRAHMREVAEEVFERFDRFTRIWDRNKSFETALRLSETWERMKPHLTDRNRKLITKGVWAAVQDHLKKTSKTGALKVVWEGKGRKGDPSHLTRNEQGTISVEAAMKLKGKKGEQAYLKWRTKDGKRYFGRYPEERWLAFVEDIRKRGIQEPVFIVVDPDEGALVYEGNHRIQAADQAGLREVPVEIRYFGHTETGRHLVDPRQRRSGSNLATPSQVSYATSLLAGLIRRKLWTGDIPDFDTMMKDEISEFIDMAKDKRGKPLFYGDGEFKGWEMPDGSIVRVATKSESEKEEEQVEKIHKRNPPKKPPRFDLRNRRLKEDDPDISNQGADKDKDLSLNYKRIAARWLAGHGLPPSHLRVAAFKLAQEEESFEEYLGRKKYKSDETGHDVEFKSLPTEQQSKVREEERPKWEKAQEEEKAKGKGKAEDEPDPKEVAKTEREKAREAVRQLEDALDATFRDEGEGGVGVDERGKLEGQHENLRAEAEKLEAEIEAKQQEILDTEGDTSGLEKQLGELQKKHGVVSQDLEKADGALKGKSPLAAVRTSVVDAMEALNDNERARIAEITQKEIDAAVALAASASGLPNRILDESRKAVTDPVDVEKIKSGKPGEREEALQALAKQMAFAQIAQNITFNPRWVGGQKVRNEAATPKQLDTRKRAAYDQYSRMNAEERDKAQAELKEMLDESAKDPKRAAEHEQLQAIQNGLNLARMVNGEDVTGKYGEPPSDEMKNLVKVLHNRGDAGTLLAVMDDWGSPESEKLIQDTIGEMDVNELLEISGGEDGPFGPTLSAIAKGEGTMDPAARKYVLDRARRMLGKKIGLESAALGDILAEEEKRKVKPTPTSKGKGKPSGWAAMSSKDKEIEIRKTAAKLNAIDREFAKALSKMVPEDQTQDYIKEMADLIEAKKVQVLTDLSFEKTGGLTESMREMLARMVEEGIITPERQQKIIETAKKRTEQTAQKTGGLSHRRKKTQSLFYKPHGSSGGLSHALCGVPKPQGAHGAPDLSRRQIMARRMSKRGAAQVTATLDRIASLFEQEWAALGVPQRIAEEYAYRTDLLSDAIDKGAGFDPHEIGREDAGPLVDEPDEPWMAGEFTQQENRELREDQESGKLDDGVADAGPRAPHPGKQARGKKAHDEEVVELGGMRDQLKMCAVQMKASNLTGLAPIVKGVDGLTKELDSVVDRLIAQSAAPGLEYDLLTVAAEKILNAVAEVVPHVKDLSDQVKDVAADDSPTDQLRVQEMIEADSERLQKLLSLADGIVKDAAKEIPGKAAPAEKKARKRHDHGFNLYK